MVVELEVVDELEIGRRGYGQAQAEGYHRGDGAKHGRSLTE
jgi:hypothetical protein